MSTFPQNPKEWVKYPEKKSIHTLRVDSLEASTKFEGKWILQAYVEGLGDHKFWLSHKQAGGVHRNLDADTLWVVVDTGNPEKPRFVWCSNNAEWLKGAFLKPKDGEEQTTAPEPAPKPTVEAKKPFKKPAGQVPANRFDNPAFDEELPF